MSIFHELGKLLDPDWLRLSRLGKLRMVRSMYVWFIVVPIAARILEPLPAEVRFTIFEAEVVLGFDLPFSWKVFFFSSACLAIASALYSFYCPDFIQQYENYEDFREKTGDSQLLIKKAVLAYSNELDQKKARTSREPSLGEKTILKPFVHQFADAFEVKDVAGTTTMKHTPPFNPDNFMTVIDVRRNKSDAFYWTRDILSSSRLGVRRACGLFFVLGLFLLAAVFTQTVLFVISYTLEHA